MAQQRHPNYTTSVSGIVESEWKAFDARATQEALSRKEAIGFAIEDLVTALHRGEEIVWLPSRKGQTQTRAIKIHADYLALVEELSEQVGYRKNVIIGTAIHRWVNRP